MAKGSAPLRREPPGGQKKMKNAAAEFKSPPEHPTCIHNSKRTRVSGNPSLRYILLSTLHLSCRAEPTLAWASSGSRPVLCYSIVKYFILLYYTILYYTILYYTVLYCTILHYTMLYYTIIRGPSGLPAQRRRPPAAPPRPAPPRTCIHEYQYIYTHLNSNVCVHKCIYMYIYIYTHTSLSLYLYIYIYIGLSG